VTTVRLSDGTWVHVRMSKRGAKLTEADIKAIEEVRDALLAICPGCGCYRHRCACDLREQQDGKP
jgi:hypothetical protein